MDAEVDAYIDGSEMWPAEMAALRPVLLDRGLTESIKWNKPCFDHEGRNIAIMQEMKDFLSLMFFKGALLEDPEGVLVSQGENTRSALRIELTSVEQVRELADTIGALVDAAIDVEDAGLEVDQAPEPEWADVLAERLASDDAFREAFEGLTPGRRREYNLHISDAKKVETRASRLEKYAPKILAGKGMRDR